MYSNDPIADMLTRIRNALARRKSAVIVPHSSLKEEIAKILRKYRFIVGYEVRTLEVKGSQRRDLLLKLTDEKVLVSPLNQLKRLSSPGRRVYAGVDQIPRVKNGRGLVIVSTDKGLMTGWEAQKSRLGGEIICSIY